MLPVVGWSADIEHARLHGPVIDRVFGTLFLPPERFPRGYGLTGQRMPDGFLRQLVAPFRKQRSQSSSAPRD